MPDTRVSNLKRRAFVGSLAAAGSVLASPTVLKGQASTQLRFSSWLPISGLVAPNLFKVWADDVAKITEGRVELELLPAPLGPPPAHLGLVQSGETDVAYSLHGYTQGAFERARIGQFAFLGDAYSASHAFSKVYGKLLKAEEEHENMRLLGLFQHGPGVLMLKDKVIRQPEDYKGLRVRTSGGFIGDLMTDLGAENVPMSPTDVRQALIEGRIDGVAFPYEGALAFNIVDQISFISELPNGYYNATWFLGMSEQAAQRISPEDFELIRERSASTVHVLAAKAFDYADYLGKEELLKNGTIIEKTTQETTAHIEKLAQIYEQSWAETLTADGFDGARALAFTRRITRGG